MQRQESCKPQCSVPTARLPSWMLEVSVGARFLSLEEAKVFGEQKCLSCSWEGETLAHPCAEESSWAASSVPCLLRNPTGRGSTLGPLHVSPWAQQGCRECARWCCSRSQPWPAAAEYQHTWPVFLNRGLQSWRWYVTPSVSCIGPFFEAVLQGRMEMVSGPEQRSPFSWDPCLGCGRGHWDQVWEDVLLLISLHS